MESSSVDDPRLTEQANLTLAGNVNANGLNIYYEEYGDGPSLLLLHGGMSNGQQTWGTYIPILAKAFRVIAPDSRGHGKTNNPTEQFTWQSMAEDIIAFVQELNLRKPLICGFSDGAQIAFEIGKNYPDLPQALVLAGGPGYKFLGTAASTVKFKQLLGMTRTDRLSIDETEIEDIRPNFACAWRKAHEQLHGPHYWKRLIQQIWPIYTKQPCYTAESFRKVIAPTLIIIGDRDEFVPVEECNSPQKLDSCLRW